MTSTTPTTPVIEFSDLQPIITALQNQLNADSIVGVIAGIAGAAVALAFLWWGARKVTRIMMAAFKKGRLSI